MVIILPSKCIIFLDPSIADFTDNELQSVHLLNCSMNYEYLITPFCLFFSVLATFIYIHK